MNFSKFQDCKPDPFFLQLCPVGFIDDDPRTQGTQINGYPVLGTLDSIETILGNYAISEIIVAQDNLSKEKLDRLSQICNPRQFPLRRFRTRLEKIINQQI